MSNMSSMHKIDFEVFEEMSDRGAMDEMLSFLEDNKEKLIMEDQPESYFMRFYQFDNLSHEATTALVERLIGIFGRVVMCRDASYCMKRPFLLGDEILHDYDNMIPKSFMYDLRGAFALASDCSQLELRMLYNLDLWYAIAEPQWSYEYDEIKAKNAPIAKEIQEYLWNPNRIAAWLDAGNKLEDYLP